MTAWKADNKILPAQPRYSFPMKLIQGCYELSYMREYTDSMYYLAQLSPQYFHTIFNKENLPPLEMNQNAPEFLTAFQEFTVLVEIWWEDQTFPTKEDIF